MRVRFCSVFFPDFNEKFTEKKNARFPMNSMVINAMSASRE